MTDNQKPPHQTTRKPTYALEDRQMAERQTASRVPPHILEAGCRVLYERVTEAYEPEWQELVEHIYIAMLAKAGYKPL